MSDLIFKRIKNPVRNPGNVSFLPIKKYQTAKFRGTIETRAKNGGSIKVRSTIRNTTFGFDLSQFNQGSSDDLENNLDIHELEDGEMYDFDVAINTFVNKQGGHTVYLYAMSASEPSDRVSQLEADLTDIELLMNVSTIYKTDFKNTLLLEAFRVGSQGENRELYTLRYFNTKEELPDIGLHKVRFGLYKNKFWINSKGEVSEALKPYQTVDGETREGQQWTECLEATSLKPLGTE